MDLLLIEGVCDRVTEALELGNSLLWGAENIGITLQHNTLWRMASNLESRPSHIRPTGH